MAQLMACGLHNIPICRIWNANPFDGHADIASILPKTITLSLLKHFRFASPKNLPNKGDDGYHPLQNIRRGIAFIQERSQLLWKEGLCKYPIWSDQSVILRSVC